MIVTLLTDHNILDRLTKNAVKVCSKGLDTSAK